jgi:hypothetical protein
MLIVFIRPDWRRFVKPNSALERLYGRYERKFSPDQPRVPAGSSEGGQWTSEGGFVGDDAEGILAKAKQIAMSGGASYARCLDLCYPILERFSLPGSDKNTFDFHKCMKACLGK